MAADRRCAYYEYCSNDIDRKKEDRHPQMSSLLYLLAWQILSACATGLALFGLLLLTVPDRKWEEYPSLAPASEFLCMIFVNVGFFGLSSWRFPRHQLPLMGTARKFALEMAALLAAAISSATVLLRGAQSGHLSIDLINTLVAVTTLVYVHIKHWFVFYDLKLRDLFLVVSVQVVIYYTLLLPRYRVAAIVPVLCLVAYRLWPWPWGSIVTEDQHDDDDD
ncbi:hypothetical protein LINGRAHAP2_LOCUS29687, partial [Linum grandiflorum]